MFGISLSDCGVVVWHQLIFVFTLISSQFKMFLGRSESLKWIRRKFTKRNNNTIPASIEHTPAKQTKTNNEIHENIRDLNEILVITSRPTTPTTISTKTKIAAVNEPTTPETAIQSHEINPELLLAPQQIAPIACEEDAEEMEEEKNQWSIDKNANDDEIKINKSKQIEEEHQQNEQHQQQQQSLNDVINENVVRRSKSSRVRNYLRKCKDRWLAVGNGHNANAEHGTNTTNATTSITTSSNNTSMEHDPKSTMSALSKSNVSQHHRRLPLTVSFANDSSNSLTELGNEASSAAATSSVEAFDSKGIRHHHRRHSKCALGSLEEIEDDDVFDDSYEDIDFGLGYIIDATSPRQAKATKSKINAENVSHLPAQRSGQPPTIKCCNENVVDHFDVHGNVEKQLAETSKMESKIAALIDSHLACIYPVFTQTTRAVLIREARDVLVKSYHGCLATFRRQFLCKFIEIVVMLEERHRIGEALIWCQGWPLVTPIGEVILHLGGLDDDQLKPAEIYLCVKTANFNSEPKLYAIWRTPPTAHDISNATTSSAKTTTTTTDAVPTLKSGSTLKSCQLDYNDSTLYLSPITLEMLSDDLPQLLQNLLIGVEHNLERLSLNQLPHLPASNYDDSPSKTTALSSSSSSACKDDNGNNHNNPQTTLLMMKPQIPNSPKCILRRSELITKNNKLHNSKYMLRRFTNRQDSMNSTSSGNSSASGLSTASSNSNDSYNAKANLSQFNSNNNKCIIISSSINNSNTNGNNCGQKQQNETKSSDGNTSPALPRFCLGTSFPHIDSDEENAEERRNSLNDDQLESEIIPPNLITDLPEKLLLSGIYLPGTHDMKGNPLVTVDAESVLTAGLNCYEIATLLLYYSTIPECNATNNNNNLSGSKTELSTSPQRSSNQLVATTATTTSTMAETSTIQASSSAVTTSTATCTSLNDNMQPQQQQPQQQHQQSEQLPKQQQQRHVTFTILIAIEKSQHLCVIDLISQSLKLLTRHIAYCHLLAVCLDSSLMQSPKTDTGVAVVGVVAATTNDDVKSTDMINEKPSTIDSNGNWRCHKKTETHTITFMAIDEVTTSVAATETPSGRLGGLHHHDARKWREFFVNYEPFYQQCTGAAHRLVAALNDIRHADLQGLPTRRQLYAQHRALSRALMDSELHNLRKRSTTTMARLQELAKCINHNNNSNIGGTKINSYGNIKSSKTITVGGGGGGGAGGGNAVATAVGGGSGYYSSSTFNRNKIMGIGSTSYSFNYQGNQNNKSVNNNNTNNNNSQLSHNVAATSAAITTTKSSSTPVPLSSTTATISSSLLQTQINATNPLIKSSIYSTSFNTASRLSANHSSNNISSSNNNNVASAVANMDVAIRLQKVTLLYNEIDRAAKRLEQLTEQRREHLRELTRQRALEDEINEVTAWITNDGSDSLQRFINFELDWDTPMKEREQEFEKYYFISMKNLAKGRDLNVAAANMETLRESAIHLKKALDSFADKLENARERIEGASRLHYLLQTKTPDDNCQQEIERLALEYGVKDLLEKHPDKCIGDEVFQRKSETQNNMDNPTQKPLNVATQIISSTPDAQRTRTLCQRSSYGGTGSYDSPNNCHCWRDSRTMDYMEDDMLDNDEEEGQSKIADSGVGECQRCEGNPKLTRMCSCQSLNEDNENLYKKHDELDDECFEQPSKCYNIHSPLEANKHLQCFASTFELPKLEELSCLDPKIQKTLLLIMREMIGTERDYVRSLYYVIENYIDELLRDDIPQSMRGQRNVIFGNIEKIFEFHNNNFLIELERYEHNPLKVGAAFLQMESKFYLYALYNKNKPKSDTLMSEYGTAFFKSKQLELKDKMDLASYLLKPVQRMGKYALLLQQLVKACSNVEGSALQEISADVEELQKAEEMVKFQLRHGNDLLAMDSLRDCDVNVKEQGRLLRQNEFLVWQGRGGKKTLRHIFLFEELVLFSKSRRFPDHKNLDLYIYKNSIKTSDIGLTAHTGDSPTKFEIWFRKRKPEDTYTLQSMSEDIKNLWTEEISKLLWQQAKRNREIRLAEMSSMGIGSKPCLDIRPSNNQINDRSITISQLGKAPKLRHSFVGLHSDQTKSSRRPTSLISESSLSSGTSSSSLSKSSTASSTSSAHNHYLPGMGLELINESQTLEHCGETAKSHTGCTSHIGEGSGGGTINSRHRNCHKRSTTIVSQLSMESGIMSDICMTPDQDNNDLITTWPSNPTDALISPTNNTAGNRVFLRCHSYNFGKKFENHHQHHLHAKDSKSGEVDDHDSQQQQQS